VAVASAVVFLMVSVLVHLLVGMHDRSSPIALGSPPRLTIELADSGVEGQVALEALRRLDGEASLGLVKQTADVGRDLRGAVLLPVNGNPTVPRWVERYQDDPARVVGQAAWSHTTVSGSYYATGDASALPRAISELERAGLRVSRDDTSIRTGLAGLIRLKSMVTAFVTVCVLLATLVLYWLAVKSRRRALSVLAGTPVGRVQLHDLGQLMLLVAAVWLPMSVAATILVGLGRAWVFAPVFAAYLGVLGGLMLVVALVAALWMSAVSVPSPGLIARRAPATLGVRRAAGAIKGVTFVLVLLVIGPAWVALSQASTQAEQLSRWERLADYASVEIGLASEADLRRLEPMFGEFVGEAEDDDSLLFSAMYVREEGGLATMGTRFAELLGPRWTGVALVNQQWLDVMAADEQARLVDVPSRELPRAFLSEMTRTFDELWGRSETSAEETASSLRYLTPASGTVPLIGSARELDYRDDVLIAVVPSVSEGFSDGNLVNFSTGGLLFAGFDETQRRLESHGLARDLTVQRAAETGLLLAQFAAYEAWLSTAAIVGLGIALVIAAAMSAYIAALLQARNDFVRRLAGHPWLPVVSGRVVPELAIGGVVAVLVLMVQPSRQVVPVVVTVLLMLIASPVVHVLAARRGFADVVARRL
jgi:hypothetical protein